MQHRLPQGVFILVIPITMVCLFPYPKESCLINSDIEGFFVLLSAPSFLVATDRQARKDFIYQIQPIAY